MQGDSSGFGEETQQEEEKEQRCIRKRPCHSVHLRETHLKIAMTDDEKKQE